MNESLRVTVMSGKIMCEDCNFGTKYENGFPSESDYSQTRKMFSTKVEDGTLISLGLDNSEPTFYHEIFQCKSCGYKWKLSFPDNAYRGGLKNIWKLTTYASKRTLGTRVHSA